MIESRSVVLDGVRVSYLEKGSAQTSTPTLLLLHGLIAVAKTYEPLMAQLAGFHVIAVDLPGTAESGEACPLGFADLAALVRQLISHLRLENVVVVGHSHGGALALRIAATQPDGLQGLVLIAPAHPFSGHERTLIWFYGTLPGRLFAHSIPYWPRSLQLIGMKRMLGPKQRADFSRFIYYRQRLQAPNGVAETLGIVRAWKQDMAVLGADLEAEAITLPVLLLWGSADPAVPIATAPALMAHLADAQLVTLDGIGHLPPEEATADCARAITTWVHALQQAPAEVAAG